MLNQCTSLKIWTSIATHLKSSYSYLPNYTLLWMIPEHQSSLNLVTTELIVDHWLGYSRKSKPTGGWRAHFFEKPLEFFISFTLPLEIPDKTKLHPWKFHKIALDHLEIPRPNHQDPWKFYIIFFGHPCKFLLLFLWYPFKSHILYPSPHSVWFSSGIAHLKTASWLAT